MTLEHVNIYVRAAASPDWCTKILGLHTYHFAEGRASLLSADKSMSHEVANAPAVSFAVAGAQNKILLNRNYRDGPGCLVLQRCGQPP